ncbi:hypothetical protein HS088_TW17G00448 [Tripterygium wilfordii]|uniref:Uncharacterized protein n=1 Tax=Tripterygium wilfordii TaxID=458696 RepID=A0A7J7CG01_TRIWF|nr:hypothetical protein HS088_TW17G00448 [Tripterygium wilfordii]
MSLGSTAPLIPSLNHQDPSRDTAAADSPQPFVRNRHSAGPGWGRTGEGRRAGESDHFLGGNGASSLEEGNTRDVVEDDDRIVDWYRHSKLGLPLMDRKIEDEKDRMAGTVDTGNSPKSNPWLLF